MKFYQGVNFYANSYLFLNFFFPSPFFQTFLASIDFQKSHPNIYSKKERVKIAETTLDWVYMTSNKELDKILLIIPGLTGSVDDFYIRDLCLDAIRSNYRPIVYNNRWLAEPPIFDENKNVDFIEDLRNTINYLVDEKKCNKLFVVGISYGSNLLVKYLGLYPNDSKIIAACSIGNPFNMYKNQKIISGFWNKMLTYVLIKALKQRKHYYLNSKIKGISPIDVENALKSNRFQEFDDNFTRKVLGYGSIDEYYKDMSSSNVLHNVKTPLFCLQSHDDPISHSNCIPYETFKENENIILLETKRGGHIGWMEGVLNRKTYFPKPCIEFLNYFN